MKHWLVTLYSITNQCSIFEPLKDICGVDIKEMEKLVDNLEKTSRFSVGMAMKYFGELLKIISKVFKGKEKIITEDVMSICLMNGIICQTKKRRVYKVIL